MRRRTLLAAAGAALLGACSSPAAERATAPRTSRPGTTAPSPTTEPAPTSAPPTAGTPAEVLARSTVPVLCFHQLREFRAEDSAYARTMITPPAAFRLQLQALRDGGRTPIGVPELLDHLQLGAPLPDRPVLLTFDDGSATHHSVALPLLRELGFPAAFFPMTVVLGKPGWLSPDQLRELDAAGMTIGAHSWDHQRVDRLSGDQWAVQLDQPRAELAGILGHPVETMAYPHGTWSPEALPRVQAAGYRAAFQLADPQDPAHPLLTIRRIMPPPTWDGPTLLARLDAF
ncbi:polysaccharide deacetylase family protein [Blastococcus sp. MG754426]|uniref:polysaccharide deacetylase family protein n=1 Tax=unclassified Blastococcus TaxID=2619396 RepID=UPI001EF07772|nr:MULTISPECIES: polysaccharide deacetylase family protein [unclassified Blastococcus]MCF6509572.1 polysaccharide deacetylase family protein [Blastococcus sp. MG754426]MCF6514232.1 polysaccharide deacetylase family protein [Blastococcus sp. MG754427]MCF6737385.1 polysaccharide deacetylase family protein [Blastococcus sp. KM273129]